MLPIKPQAIEQEASFRLMFDGNPLPMWIYDTQSLEILAVNSSATRHYGYAKKIFLEMRISDLRADRNPAEPTRNVAGSVPSGMSITSSERHVKRGGEEIEMELTWSRIQFAGHDAVFVMAHDVTERKRSEVRIREQASLLHLAHDAIIATDFGDRIHFWNKGAERLYKWTADDTVKQPLETFLKIAPETQSLAKIALLESGEWTGELKQETRDGRKIVVASRWTLVRDAAGEPKTILIINTDITERKTLESQFLRTQRLEGIGTLASGIAHDLNNILTPIAMSIALLRRSVADAGAQRLLTTIEVSAERGADIVKQVLTFARGAEGERVVLQPRHLIGEIVKIMNQTFPRNINIRTAFPKELWTMEGDATQLHQVFLNLCVNARDAMPLGGLLTLTAENTTLNEEQCRALDPNAKAGPFMELRISDTGTGIPPEVIENIFDPFFTTKEHGKGTGLGLSTVVGIVKGHGGFISVDSNHDGLEGDTGTTFRILIPAVLNASDAVAEGVKTEIPLGNGELVLVVDDEPSIREAASSTLQAAGYRVFTAEDGNDALALYFQRRQEIALILTDLVMELMDGIALTRAVRRMAPDANIIVSSGQMDPEKAATLQSLGVNIFLDKPYTAEKLLRVVHAALHPEPAPDAVPAEEPLPVQQLATVS